MPKLAPPSMKAVALPTPYTLFMRNEFTAIIEAAPEGGYFAYCPEIPGANGQGETVEECQYSLSQAIVLILEDRRADALRGVPDEAIRRTVRVE